MIGKNQILIIALCALMAIIISPVSAQTITFANPNGIAERDYLIYYGNGTLAAFVNSTSVVTLDGSLDYIFTLKPVQTNLLEDPADWLSNTGFPFIQTNVIPIMILFFLVAMIFGRR